MEPADLNQSDDKHIEALLRRPAAALPDDGFSERVMAALPSTRLPSRTARNIAIGAGATAGVIFAGLGIMRSTAAPADLLAIANELSRAAQPIFDPAFGVTLLVTAMSVAYVFRRRLRLI